MLTPLTGNVSGKKYGLTRYNAKKDSLAKLLDPDVLSIFLYPQMRQNVVFWETDFQEVTWNGDYWTKTVDTGPDFAITALVNGKLRFTSGTDDNEGGSIIGPAIYKGDLNCGMEARFQFSRVANIAFDFGFIDDVTDKTTPAVTDVDTPAFGSGLTEGAVVHCDTDQTFQTMALVLDSATYATATKVTLYNNANPVAAYMPTAAVDFVLRMQIVGDRVHVFIFDDEMSFVYHATAPLVAATSGGIEGGTAIRPWIAFANKVGSASGTFDIDYVRIWQDRFV